MQNNKVSIIIPNYNNARWIPACIDSCLAQQGDFRIEIIVVDDQSTDESWKVLTEYEKRHPNQVFIYKNPIKGGNNARNYGFSKSSGDYIQWLDSDDLILPEKFQQQISFLVSNPEVDIVYSDWRMDFYNKEIKKGEEIISSQLYQFYLKELIEDKWQPNLSYLLKRKIAEKLDHIKAWNPDTKVAQDREYFTLAAINGAKFGYVPGVFSVYNRWSSKTVSSIAFKKRLKHNLSLEAKFVAEIQKQDWIPAEMKRRLISTLKTQAIKACYYNPQLRILLPIAFSEIQWSYIHWKMRIIIPFVWIYQMIGYKFRRLFSTP